jgi:carboxylesterase
MFFLKTVLWIMLLAVAIPAVCYNIYVYCSMRREEKQFRTEQYRKKSAGFSGHGQTPAFLLIHGFSNNAWDMRPAALMLNQLGYACRSILLPGHGTIVSALRSVTAAQWLENAHLEYRMLKQKYGRVAVIGFSIGADIAIDIACRQEVSHLVCINPFFKIAEKWICSDYIESLAGLFQYIVPYVRKNRLGMINDPEKLKHYHSYWHVPLQSVRQVRIIAENAMAMISGVKVPTLWIHTRGDVVADFNSSRRMFSNLSSENKQFVEFSRSDHMILYDYDEHAVLEQIKKFIEENPA